MLQLSGHLLAEEWQDFQFGPHGTLTGDRAGSPTPESEARIRAANDMGAGPVVVSGLP